MGLVDGRVVVVTGAGRGIGRAHALAFAAEGAYVVVNDIGAGPAREVVDEIIAAGGEAVVNGDDIADLQGASSLIQTAVDTFGGLDVLVTNSSPAGLQGSVGQGNYSAAKAGVAALTLVAAAELRGSGIAVNAIAPT